MKNLFINLFFFISAASSLCAQQSLDIFTYRAGEYKISLLSEAQQNASPIILLGATQEILDKYVPTGSFPNAMNAFLVQTRDKNILVDTGLGNRIYANLHALGVNPNDIDIILITHMHGDHIGGLIQGEDIMFPRSQIYISQPEYDYWMSDDEMYYFPPAERMSFTIARNVIKAYQSRLHLFMPNELEDMQEELLPGITAIAAYGHTPGHTAYLFESGNSRFLFWGDLTHAMAVQMPYPEIAVTYDVHPWEAIESRKKILEFVEDKGIAIAGMHIAYPGMGRIGIDPERGYKFYPF